MEEAKLLEKLNKKPDDFSVLRGHLFTAMKKLEDGTMKEAEAKAMASVAQAIINSQKVELQFRGLITDHKKYE